MANTPINKVQPMREAEIAIADYINGDLANELIDLHNTDAQLQKNIDAEQARAEGAETKLTNDLATEVERAKAAEQVLTSDLCTEVERAKAAETKLTNDLATEVERAKVEEETNANAITVETERATAAEGVLQTNINTENKRAVGAEEVLTDLYGDLAAKFPVQTDNIGDAQVTETKLETNLQMLLSFCKTLPDFAYGFSDAQTIPSGSSITVEIDFGKTFQEIPEVFPVAVCNTDLNVLPTFVKYSTTSKSYVKVYNGGTTNVTNLTVGYFAVAGR